MKLKEIEWINITAHMSAAVVGGFEFGTVVAAGKYIANTNTPGYNEFIGRFQSESEAKAAVESKIKQWFNQVTE